MLTLFASITNIFSIAGIRLIAAIAILVIGLVIGRFLSKITLKLLKGLEVNTTLKKEFGIKIPVEQFVSAAVAYLVYFIFIIVALAQLGLATAILYTILIIILLFIIIFVILAVKDFIPNVVSGFLLHQKGSLKKGDLIKVKNIEGKIMSIGLIETKISTKKNEIVMLPNLILTKNEVVIKKISK